MIAEIVTTGTELLLGDTVDTNSTYIARQLRDVGVNLYVKTSVGDNVERLVRVLDQALDRSDVVITTGGLGPTVDDVTREAVARVTGRSLALHADSLAQIEGIFARWGRPIGENNLRQAYLPEGSLPIPNPVGTAPVFIVETARGAIVSLPGVPREMERLMQDSVMPYLRSRIGGEHSVIRSRILRTVGIGESQIDERIDDLMRSSNPTVGLSAHLGMVDVRITARANSAELADKLIAPIEADVRSRIGEEHVYGTEGESLEEVAVRALLDAGATLRLVETATSGELARLVRGVSGGGELVRSAEIAVNADQLSEMLCLSRASVDAFGWISEMSAAAAAAALVDTYDDGWGLVLLSDPAQHGDFYEGEPACTYIALAASTETVVVRYPFGGDGRLSRRWVVLRALNLLRVFAHRQILNRWTTAP